MSDQNPSNGTAKDKQCKHERATKTWTGEIDLSPGVHPIELGREYKYNCSDCGETWIKWE